MPRAIDFPGFPPETLTFLKGLRKQNRKTWFDAHRSDYDSFYVAPAKQFVSSLAPKLSKLVPGIVAEPKINGSIFRINRDVRFAKDKRPYKDHLDFTFWQGDKKSAPSHLFFRMSPDALYIGTGHHACPQLLKRFRTAVADNKAGKALATVARKLRKSGYELEGKHYKRMPRDFSDEGPAAEFLLHNALHVVVEERPETACDDDLIDFCLTHWKATLPLHRWLMNHV